jgi:hypothetical protein
MGSAVLQKSTVAMYYYITVYYHQSARRSSRGGAGAVLRTSPCTSHYCQSISEAQTTQYEGQGRRCARYITVYYHQLQQSARRAAGGAAGES